VRVTHLESSSPKYLEPFSPIQVLLRFRFKEARETHLEISSPKYFAPFLPILFS